MTDETLYQCEQCKWICRKHEMVWKKRKDKNALSCPQCGGFKWGKSTSLKAVWQLGCSLAILGIMLICGFFVYAAIVG